MFSIRFLIWYWQGYHLWPTQSATAWSGWWSLWPQFSSSGLQFHLLTLLVSFLLPYYWWIVKNILDLVSIWHNFSNSFSLWEAAERCLKVFGKLGTSAAVRSCNKLLHLKAIYASIWIFYFRCSDKAVQQFQWKGLLMIHLKALRKQH